MCVRSHFWRTAIPNLGDVHLPSVKDVPSDVHSDNECYVEAEFFPQANIVLPGLFLFVKCMSLTFMAPEVLW